MAKWPSPQEYFEAIQSPDCINDAELRSGVLELVGEHQLPLVFSGQFAIVFKIRTEQKTFAVRCFLNNFPDRTQRYKQISEFILADAIEHTVNFELIEQGIRIANEFYPILKMEFVSGDSLGQYLTKYSNEVSKLKALRDSFIEMMHQLQAHGIAHGDLQHDNIIITEGRRLRLIDYDGMYVPALKGWKANELGHLNYQHPKRSADHFGEELDNFSAWLIKESLDLLIAENGRVSIAPQNDCLILNREDFLRPHRSRALYELEKLSEHGKRFSQRISYLLSLQPGETPFLTEELKVPETFVQTHFAQATIPEWLDGFDPTNNFHPHRGRELAQINGNSPLRKRMPHLIKQIEGVSDQPTIIQAFGCRELFAAPSADGEHSAGKGRMRQAINDHLQPGEYEIWSGGLLPELLSTSNQDFEIDNATIKPGHIVIVVFVMIAFTYQLWTITTLHWEIVVLIALLAIVYYASYRAKLDHAITYYSLTNSNLHICFDGPRSLGSDDHYIWTVYGTTIPLTSIVSAHFPHEIGYNERVRLYLGRINYKDDNSIWLHGLTEHDRLSLYSKLGKTGIRCIIEEKAEKLTLIM